MICAAMNVGQTICYGQPMGIEKNVSRTGLKETRNSDLAVNYG